MPAITGPAYGLDRRDSSAETGRTGRGRLGPGGLATAGPTQGGDRNDAVPAELAIAAYDTAHEPRKLIIMPGGHFDAYVAGFEAASSPARDWFTQHLTA